MIKEEKQIEEMALTEIDILANELNQHCADLAENYCGGVTCLSCLAHALTAKGYRKASDVAREIFEEIEKIIDTYTDEYGTMLTLEQDEFDELKKKYTEEGKCG